LGQIYTKITNFGNIGACKSTTVMFGVKVGTWDTLPRA